MLLSMLLEPPKFADPGGFEIGLAPSRPLPSPLGWVAKSQHLREPLVCSSATLDLQDLPWRNSKPKHPMIAPQIVSNRNNP
jgi:hypothetical protein